MGGLFVSVSHRQQLSLRPFGPDQRQSNRKAFDLTHRDGEIGVTGKRGVHARRRRRTAFRPRRNRMASGAWRRNEAGGLAGRRHDGNDTVCEGFVVPFRPGLALRVSQRLNIFGIVAPAGGFSVSFVTPAKGDLSLRVFEVSDGWPDGITVPPKPVGLTPWGMSDTTYAASAFDYMWSAPQ